MNKKQNTDKKYTAFNNHLFLCVILFIVFLGLSISSAIEKRIGLSIFFVFFTLLPVVVFVLQPLWFVFSDNEIIIVYCLVAKEIIEWKDIRDISQLGSWAGNGFPRYVISYPMKEKRAFFVCGEISKTRKTKKLIEKYWNKEII